MTKTTDSTSESANSYFSTEHLKSDVKTRALRAGAITIFSRMASSSIQMVGIIVLARLLTPDDFGLVAMVASITGFFLIFKDLGLTDATIQEPEISHKQISTLFWINIAFGITVALIVVALSTPIAWFYGEPQLKSIAIISSLSFAFAGLSTQHLALLKRSILYSRIAFIEITATLVSFGTAIILARYGWSYWALVLRPIVLAMFLAIGCWFFCQWRPGLPTRRSHVRSMLIFGGNTLGYFVVNYFARSLDKTLIGWRYGAKELGYYGKAYQLFILPINQVIIPLQSVAVTTLSKLRTEPEKYRRYYLKALSGISFVAMPMCAFMVAVSDDLILLLLGPQWKKTGSIFASLGIGAVIQTVFSTMGWLHVSLGRPDRWLRWGIFGSSVTVVAFLLGLPFGPFGVATAYTLSRYVLAGPGLAYAGQPIDLKFRAILSEIWRYFVASASAAILVSSIHVSSTINAGMIPNLLVSFIIFTASYLVFILVLYQDTKPIVQFLSVLMDIFPKLSLKKTSL